MIKSGSFGNSLLITAGYSEYDDLVLDMQIPNPWDISPCLKTHGRRKGPAGETDERATRNRGKEAGYGPSFLLSLAFCCGWSLILFVLRYLKGLRR